MPRIYTLPDEQELDVAADETILHAALHEVGRQVELALAGKSGPFRLYEIVGLREAVQTDLEMRRTERGGDQRS